MFDNLLEQPTELRKSYTYDYSFIIASGYRLEPAKEETHKAKSGGFQTQTLCCPLPMESVSINFQHVHDNTQSYQPRKLTQASRSRVLLRVSLHRDSWLDHWSCLLNSISSSPHLSRGLVDIMLLKVLILT